MIRRIIVPLDGTAFGEYAIPYAVAIARRAKAAIELVHVRLPRTLVVTLPPAADSGIVPVDDIAPLFDDAEWLEERARALRATTGLRVVARTVCGHPGEALCEEIAALATDLVVMSTHARGGLLRMRLGSVGDMLVRHAAAPVLLVQPPEQTAAPPAEPQFRRVLIPLDGSPFAEQVLAPAGELMHLTGARPWLLHVVAPLPGPARRHTRIDDRTVHEQQRNAEEYLAGIARALGHDDRPITCTTVIGRQPACVIRDAAAQPDVDIVALATHGRGGITRLLVGSTGDVVLRSVTKPVLLYRPSVGDPLRGVFDPYGERSECDAAPARSLL